MGNVLIVTGIPLDTGLYSALWRVKEKGHSLYLLSDKAFEPDAGLFNEFFSLDLRKTKEVLDTLKKQPVRFDAVTLQFSDWLTPLVALIAKEYGCIGNDPITAFNCRSKYHMRKKLEEAKVPSPKFGLCRNYEELKDAVRAIGFPCVAKPVGANGSYGVFALMDESYMSGLEENYAKSVNFLKQRFAEGDIFSFTDEELRMMGIHEPINMATDYLVEEFLEGPEISVDSLTQDGRTTVMGIADQVRMSPPYFVQLAEKMPYVCSTEKEKEIAELVSKTVAAMNIQNSPAHTEIIFTKEGPKIVEIGCRIGGDNLHDTILAVTGYSMLFESVKIALGVKRDYSVKTHCHMAMQYILPVQAGIVRKIDKPAELLNDPEVNEVFLYVKEGDYVAPPPACFDYLGYVSVVAATPELAQKKLKDTIEKINISIIPD